MVSLRVILLISQPIRSKENFKVLASSGLNSFEELIISEKFLSILLIMSASFLVEALKLKYEGPISNLIAPK